MRFRIFSFALLIFVLCGFTNREFTLFHDVYIQDVVNALTGTTPAAPGPTPVEKFNNQNFILWLSPVSSESSDLPTYYNQIVTFCKTHNIRKIIWYFGYTNATKDFYDPASSDPASFVKLLQNNPLPSETNIELRIECATMNNGPVYAPTNTAPIVPSHVTLPVYMVNGNFYGCLWWVRDMYNVVGEQISGVTVDPQDNCDAIPDYSPYSTATTADQAIVNYMDEFASLNPDFYPLERGMTFDGSAKVQIFGNRSAIPITDTNLINDTNTIVNFYNGDGNGYATWTRPNPADPFLNNVYPQLYNISSDYIYTLAKQPQSAGLKFLQLLSETPYCPGLTPAGALSGITFTPTSDVITGVNTQFTAEIDPNVNPNSPIGFIDSTGTQQCVFPNNDPHYPNTPVSVACTGKVRNVVNNTQLTLNISPTTTQTNVPWLYVENEINYREYYLTPSMISGIFLMFSAEGPFFGQWTLDQFMNFVTSFYQQGQSYSLYYQDPITSSDPIPVPNQFAIFTYEQMTGKSSPSPPIVWFPGE